ncbi:MAG: UDP-N-acetylmuramoyl-L-alanyl-D-glutamate--2,6-diaminopimelate ligase [Candidatus Moranbacteria bacterium]|nr:UDP-N-acetylmuramoyl-L-alanyl-D-glutamate--2,6-diaminopimelate ligase [Candidatus Moranbacteria bacterium]
MKKIIPQSVKNIYHLFQAVLANVWHGFPSRKLKAIGVTGTNGKTTTVQMIAKILEEAGDKVAVASTINFKIGEKEWVNDTKFTTLSSWRLQRHLSEAVKAGCSYAVLEISSHSLDQNRVWGTDFDVAAITNLTREHLDYHETMEKYAKAKEKLFAMTAKNINGATVVNLAMEKAEDFLKYGVKDKYGYHLATRNVERITQFNTFHEIISENIELGTENTKYQIQDTSFQINLPGEFNVENALAATCVGLSQNIALPKISQALAKIKGVSGRMEHIENDRGLEIIVDFAVTPDSLEKLYNYINKLKKENAKIIAVFGSCGERDRGKRPIMGEIVARHADYCFVTNEDPYNEDPQKIIDEVFAGVLKHKKENENAWRIFDRREAIKKALQIAKSGDIVAVTGKGAEEIMVVGAKRIPWNDPRVIREILSEQMKK